MSPPPLVFVDTNVFVYSVDDRDEIKQHRARAWLGELWERRVGRTSAQVLNELYVTLTRKLDGVSVTDARRLVDSLAAWQPVPLTASITHLAWAVEDLHGFSWWDSLVVAAAQRAGCGALLTEDLQHGQQLEEVQVVNPFEFSPQELFAD